VLSVCTICCNIKILVTLQSSIGTWFESQPEKSPVMILIFLELREFLVAKMGIITSNLYSPSF